MHKLLNGVALCVLLHSVTHAGYIRDEVFQNEADILKEVAQRRAEFAVWDVQLTEVLKDPSKYGVDDAGMTTLRELIAHVTTKHERWGELYGELTAKPAEGEPKPTFLSLRPEDRNRHRVDYEAREALYKKWIRFVRGSEALEQLFGNLQVSLVNRLAATLEPLDAAVSGAEKGVRRSIYPDRMQNSLKVCESLDGYLTRKKEKASDRALNPRKWGFKGENYQPEESPQAEPPEGAEEVVVPQDARQQDAQGQGAAVTGRGKKNKGKK